MRAALYSRPARLGDVDANVQAVADACGQTEADLLVWPEMFLTGYNIGDDAQRLAFRDGDERLEPLLRAAKKHRKHVIVGAPHSPRRGLTHNAALCIDDEGTVVWVHKRYLPSFTTFREALFFARGGEQRPWRTRLGDIGIGICYDLYFPELHRRQALSGCDVLVNISASPNVSQRFFESLLPARAIENACFMLYSNNVGAQDGLLFWGGSQGYGPRGESLGRLQAWQDGEAEVDVDLEDLTVAREGRPTLRDSLPDSGLLPDSGSVPEA